MKKSTVLILSGFIESMKKDIVGWNDTVIGEIAYEIYRLIEQVVQRCEIYLRQTEKFMWYKNTTKINRIFEEYFNMKFITYYSDSCIYSSDTS